jgi:hypothetical protein
VEKGKIVRKWTAGYAVVAFTWMAVGVVASAQLKAGTAKAENTAATVEATKSGNPESSSFEKESGKQEIVKKNKFPWFLVACGAVVVGIVVYFVLIKKTNHILVVDIGPGASGNPAAGKYTYKKGEKIAYDFTCADGYKNLTVFVDDKIAAAAGTIVMDRAHGVRVETTQLAEYSLAVNVESGINGIPNSGTYKYREGTTVPYQYSFENRTLTVKLDDISVSQSGSLLMNKDHVLQAQIIYPLFDIRGKWHIELKDDGQTQARPIVDFLFSGTDLSGKFEVLKDPSIPYWSGWWGDHGKYEITKNQIILEFYDDFFGFPYDWFIYNFIGKFTSNTTITGIYHYETEPDASPRGGDGTWTATRIE